MSKKLVEYVEEYLKFLQQEKAKPKEVYNINIINTILHTLVNGKLNNNYEQE